MAKRKETSMRGKGLGARYIHCQWSTTDAARFNGHRLGPFKEGGMKSSKLATAVCAGCGAAVTVYQHAVLMDLKDGWEQDPQVPRGKALTNVVGEAVVNAPCPAAPCPAATCTGPAF